MKTVLCHGVFDLLNSGHVEHLKGAKSFGDFLIVSVVPDRFLTKSRPVIYDENERLSIVSSIKYVNKAVLCEGPGPEDVIKAFIPDVYVRGHDYIGKRMPESDLLEKLGIPIKYTESCLPHSTEIIEKILSHHDRDTWKL